MVKALKEQGVCHQFMKYVSGRHGASLANRSCYNKNDITENMKDIREWPSSAVDFVFEVLDNNL